MNSIRINTALNSFAKHNHLGQGTFNLKNGTRVFVLSNPKTELFHVFQIKDEKLLGILGGKGHKAMSNIIDKFKPHANLDDIYKAFEHSFHVIG
jgi:hypothetical protein